MMITYLLQSETTGEQLLARRDGDSWAVSDWLYCDDADRIAADELEPSPDWLECEPLNLDEWTVRATWEVRS